MYIFIDESGTFPTTSNVDSWSAIAAYVSPDDGTEAIETLVSNLKASKGNVPEVKLGMLGEQEYFAFLHALGKLDGIAFAAASDMSLSSREVMAHHQAMQSLGVVKYREKMAHQAVRECLDELSQAVKEMPPNLYAQMMFQIRLFHDIVTRSVLYFVQRNPKTLSSFKWRVDQKDVVLTEYEKTFRHMLPVILQSISIDDPILMVREFDYSSMSRYEFAPDGAPNYLQAQYDLPEMEGFNIGMMVSEDFKFVDSKSVIGVQVADLIASGIRRLLKGEFRDNETAAMLLGQLTLQNFRTKLPVKLVSLGAGSAVNGELAGRLRILDRFARPMFLPR